MSIPLTEDRAVWNGKPLGKPSELPHGLLLPPQAVLDLVAREEARRPMTLDAKARITQDFVLQYYFEGMDVAYRHTSVGVEVLAVGLPEIGQFLNSTPLEEQSGIIFGQP